MLITRLRTPYNLDMILAVGYRVRSVRGTQFRRFANTVLKEYLVKVFAMNDQRLKQKVSYLSVSCAEPFRGR